MGACRLLWPFYLVVYTVDHASQRERLRGNLSLSFPDNSLPLRQQELRNVRSKEHLRYNHTF